MEHEDESTYEEQQISWGDLFKSMFKDPESRMSLLDNIKNISLFIASSMVIAKYADKISEPKLIMKLLFDE